MKTSFSGRLSKPFMAKYQISCSLGTGQLIVNSKNGVGYGFKLLPFSQKY
jgi:hypothetical protein